MVVKAVESVVESAVESVVLVSIVEAVDCRLRLLRLFNLLITKLKLLIVDVIKSVAIDNC